MSELRLKVLIIGPRDAGKTFLVNTLAKHPTAQLRPTVGCRIVEYDDGHHTGGYDDSVELWDCSGAEDYEKCFAALKQDVCGIVYVYNPEHQPQSEGLSYWYKHFNPRTCAIDPTAMLFCQIVDSSKQHYPLPQVMTAGAPQAVVVAMSQPLLMKKDEVATGMKPAFDKYLERVAAVAKENQRRQEESILNNQ